MTEIAAALGFGLFAILSIIRLRSEPFNNREIGYFFGALVLGLMNGIGTPDLWFTLLGNLVILVAIFLLDHPRILQTAQRCELTLDSVHTDRQILRDVVGERLRATVVDVTVISIDFIRDSMKLEVLYHERSEVPMSWTPPTMNAMR